MLREIVSDLEKGQGAPTSTLDPKKPPAMPTITSQLADCPAALRQYDCQIALDAMRYNCMPHWGGSCAMLMTDAESRSRTHIALCRARADFMDQSREGSY